MALDVPLLIIFPAGIEMGRTRPAAWRHWRANLRVALLSLSLPVHPVLPNRQRDE